MKKITLFLLSLLILFALVPADPVAAARNEQWKNKSIADFYYPGSVFKVFLVADDTVRAQRRLLELQEKGIATTLEEVLTDMRTRDANDRQNQQPHKS